MANEKQDLIIKLLSEIEVATFNQIIKTIPFIHHHNSRKNIADILGNLIKDGKVYRIDKYRYRLRKESDNFNQESLF